MHLRLDQNNLTAKAIEIGLYGLRKTLTLRTLSVVEINLSDLNNLTFQHLKSVYLHRLDMRDCQIQLLRSGMFQYLKHLESLDLSHNKISSIQACVFPKTNRLSYLVLDSNKLFEIPEARSTQFENISYLSIRQNAIQRISYNSLRNFKNLTHLLLTRNDISLLETGCFKHSFQLKALDLSYNKITRDINNDFVGLKKLTFLGLKQNNIPKVASTTLQSSPSSDHLTLSGNKLLGKNMEALYEIWKSLHLLQILDISNLRIANLPLHIFQGLAFLERLALASNDLTGWNETVFKDQKNLKILTITDNKITHISRKHFQYLVSLRELYLANNPFRCTCELLHFVQWIENPRGLYFGGIEGYMCEAPAKWAKKPLLEYDISEDDCTSYLWFDIIIAGGCIYAFLVTLSSVAYRKRWYIRYILFSYLKD